MSRHVHFLLFSLLPRYLHTKRSIYIQDSNRMWLCSAQLQWCHLMFMAADIARNSFAISEKGGLDSGSDDQHLSINDLHVGSHQLGISGRRLPLIIPAENIRKSCFQQILITRRQENIVQCLHKEIEHYLLFPPNASLHKVPPQSRVPTLQFQMNIHQPTYKYKRSHQKPV